MDLSPRTKHSFWKLFPPALPSFRSPFVLFTLLTPDYFVVNSKMSWFSLDTTPGILLFPSHSPLGFLTGVRWLHLAFPPQEPQPEASPTWSPTNLIAPEGHCLPTLTDGASPCQRKAGQGTHVLPSATGKALKYFPDRCLASRVMWLNNIWGDDVGNLFLVTKTLPVWFSLLNC